jgi:hypothetical protein
MSRELLLQLEGYGLTTAEISYRLPDHPALLQLCVWQDTTLRPPAVIPKVRHPEGPVDRPIARATVDGSKFTAVSAGDQASPSPSPAPIKINN